MIVNGSLVVQQTKAHGLLFTISKQLCKIGRRCCTKSNRLMFVTEFTMSEKAWCFCSRRANAEFIDC
ncbi:hypothetical protein KC320_g227 [Hortaea werneckii]|nr:hypothetical protein KC320_g227 [Hortaea werneckii]